MNNNKYSKDSELFSFKAVFLGWDQMGFDL